MLVGPVAVLAFLLRLPCAMTTAVDSHAQATGLTAGGAPTMLYLRHGGQLSTEAPSMDVINPEEMAAAMELHAKTQYFHSDFAVSFSPDAWACICARAL